MDLGKSEEYDVKNQAKLNVGFGQAKNKNLSVGSRKSGVTKRYSKQAFFN